MFHVPKIRLKVALFFHKKFGIILKVHDLRIKVQVCPIDNVKKLPDLFFKHYNQILCDSKQWKFYIAVQAIIFHAYI